jgi:hypothetical protein
MEMMPEESGSNRLKIDDLCVSHREFQACNICLCVHEPRYLFLSLAVLKVFTPG